jgi:hypothetical protein
VTPKTLLPIVVLALVLTGCQPAEDSASLSQNAETSAEVEKTPEEALAGAWKVVAIQDIAADGTITDYTPQESFVLFTEDYYSMAYAEGEERFQMFSERWTPNEAEQVERFSSLTVNAGLYHVSGSQLVVKPQFALYPEVMTGTSEIEYELSGDTLTLTYVGQVSGDGVEGPFYEGGAKYVVQFERLK